MPRPFSRPWTDSRRRIALLAFLAIAFSSQAAIAATKVVTDADKGGEVHLKVGDTLEVRLKSNPSTGFMWYVHKESTSLLKLLRQTTDEAEKPGAGQPVLQIFQFEARQRGSGILLLHYVRSWEKPAPDEERFQIHVFIE